jgi:TPR repeat protein
MYYSGQGISQNYRISKTWLQRSAQQGDGIAQARLGVMYANGQGVSKNKVTSLMWYRVAKVNGDDTLDKFLIKRLYTMSSEDIQMSKDMAAECMSSGYTKCGY